LQPEVTIGLLSKHPTGCMLGDDDLRLLLESANGWSLSTRPITNFPNIRSSRSCASMKICGLADLFKGHGDGGIARRLSPRRAGVDE